ncbi:MAG: V-type ATP synthase subunit B, partial [Thermoproteota archaeon]
KYLRIAEDFERRFINQGVMEDRSIEETLDLGWSILDPLSDSELKRIKPELIEKYRRKRRMMAEEKVQALT